MAQKIKDLVIQPHLHSQLMQLAVAPTQGILFHGTKGVGLYTISRALASEMTEHETSIETLAPDEKGTIAIVSIQNIYHHLKTKISHRKVIIIDDADTMSTEAQNAFLKILEEPPENHTFILTTHNVEKLLPTIRSRVQDFLVPVAPSRLTEDMIAASAKDATKSSQIRFLASGLPAEVRRLVDDEDYFTSNVAMMTAARKYLESSRYERLAALTQFANDRVKCESFIHMLIHLRTFAFDKRPDAGLLGSMEQLNETLAVIRANGNIKLQMAHLSLSLS